VRSNHKARGAWRLLLLLALLLTPGCITRQVDIPIYADHTTDIDLRGYKRGGEEIDRGYGHPASISATRISHILGAIEVRVGDREEHTLYPIVTGKTLQPISAGVAKALAQADSSQMVVVKNVRVNKRFGVFSRKHLTTFIVYMVDDYLHVKVSRINYELPRDPKAKIPEPRLGEEQMDFRTLPGAGMHSAGRQTVAVRWRDPVFQTAQRSFNRNDSGARTRQILLEESVPADEIGRALPEAVVDQLSPEVLRALADLEEERQNGLITEGEFMRQRDELLAGAGR
jgi:hypothetical protein